MVDFIHLLEFKKHFRFFKYYGSVIDFQCCVNFCVVSVEDLLIIQVGDGRRDLNDQVTLVENNNYYYDEGEDEEEKPVRTRTHYKRQEPQTVRPTIDRREIAGSTEAPKESSAPAPVAVPSAE